jgi:hypothetical protein
MRTAECVTAGAGNRGTKYTASVDKQVNKKEGKPT